MSVFQDANQKEIGARLCKKCGFIGDFDDENDRKLHGKIHSLHEKGRVDGDGVLRYKVITGQLRGLTEVRNNLQYLR